MFNFLRFVFLTLFFVCSSSYAETIFKESFSFDYQSLEANKINNNPIDYNVTNFGYRTYEDACHAVAKSLGTPISYREDDPYGPYFTVYEYTGETMVMSGRCYVSMSFVINDPRSHMNGVSQQGQSKSYSLIKDRTCPVGFSPDANGTTCTKIEENPEEPDQCEVGLSGFFEFHYCTANSTDGCIPGTQKTRPSSFCKNSCLHIPNFGSGSDADCYSYINDDGSSGPAVMCSVTAVTNGGQCSGEYSAPTPDNSCPSGTVSGEVNGNRVCVPSPDPDPDPEVGDGGGGSGGDGSDSGSGSGGDGSGSGGDGSGSGGSGSGSGGSGSGSGGDGSGSGGDGSGSGGDGSGSGSGGDGEGEEDGEGIGTGEIVENCSDGRCDFGDERGDPFGGEVRSFSDSLTAAMTGMKNSPLGNSIGNIHFPTGGTCPTGSSSINIGIGSIPIDFIEHCNFWEQIAPILSAVFLAFWAIIAVRVFLSA